MTIVKYSMSMPGHSLRHTEKNTHLCTLMIISNNLTKALTLKCKIRIAFYRQPTQIFGWQLKNSTSCV